jgi:hypothetical protein
MSISKTQIINDCYSSRVLFSWALIILFVFSIFRLSALDVPLASDELAMVSLWAQMPYLKILSNYQYPNNHIFLSLILSFLLKTFGLKEWLLRMPLLACGIVSLCLSYRLGKRISKNTNVGIFICLLMAISEKHIFYSINARGYLLLMVLALIAVTCLLDRVEGISFKTKHFPNFFNQGLAFFGWVSIWLVGTWTIPTFLFFEFSFAIFLVGLMLTTNHLLSLHKTYIAIPLASCVVGGIGFYFQYYVLIDSSMLAEAISHAAKISLPLFFPELLAEWIKPFNLIGALFFLLALIGSGKLFIQNRSVAFLIVCIWLGPVLMGLTGSCLEMLPGLPHPRTYFYLQPFFLMLGVIGARQIALELTTAVKKNFAFNEKYLLVMTGILAGVLFLISVSNYFQHNYPQRISREPLDKVHHFIKTLKFNDLLLVSNKAHVELYLYGASDIRSRLENILHDRKLDNIYYLDYEENNVLKSSNTPNLKFKRLIGNIQSPILPKNAFKLVKKFNSFKFYRLKNNWVKQFSSWEKAGLRPSLSNTQAYSWKRISKLTETLPLIHFNDSFTLAMNNKERSFSNDQGFTLNLVNIAGDNNNFTAVLLEGFMKKNKVIYDPTWMANAWILDHPYGTNIFNKVSNPAVFISKGSGNLSVMDVNFIRNIGSGSMRSFLSFRIAEQTRMEEK